MGTSTRKPISKKMIGRLHGLYTHKGMSKELKEETLLNLTDGRTAHTNELTHNEATYLWGYLNGHTASLKPATSDVLMKRRRSGCLTTMQKIGVDTTDWNRINAYCMGPTIAGKPFADITFEELVDLREKLEKILKKQEL
ncbi:MAG: hypothetical protein RR415_11755 [Ruthenibacterium sp.]